MVKLLHIILGTMEINLVYLSAVSLQECGASFQSVQANVSGLSYNIFCLSSLV